MNKFFADRAGNFLPNPVREFARHSLNPDIFSFAGGLPAPELFPTEAIAAAAERIFAQHASKAFQYGSTEGLTELREYLTDMYRAKGVKIAPANILITSGAQQSLDLVGRLFLDEHALAIVENPTYLALLSAWRPLCVLLESIPFDREGPCLSSLARQARFLAKTKLFYTIPTFQNPTGRSMSYRRRCELVSLCQSSNTILVEDDPYRELRYSGQEVPTLLEITGNAQGNVIHIGSFSKTLVPGLRVGWVVAPREAIQKLSCAKQSMDLHTSTFNQYIVHDLLQSGFFPKHVATLRTVYRTRLQALLMSLQKFMPSDASWTTPEGGMFLLLHGPSGMDGEELSRTALKENVAVVPGSCFHLSGGQNSVRLNFTHPTPERIETGIRILSQLVKALTGGCTGARQMVSTKESRLEPYFHSQLEN